MGEVKQFQRAVEAAAGKPEDKLPQPRKKKKRSWRTTLAGVAGIAWVVSQRAIAPETLDPVTDFAVVMAGLGLLFGRDQKAHDEEQKED